ncbi:glycosyltransferase [Agrobacterium tumefaciens]|uniref:glycosyltransferase n=1 Tax=Agrobacterium tumefaciens TaxID=358 RepID=UPI00129B9930|nr:rhamnan synthesis F family protein [Agrobacterium tumefaciens]MRH98142.1 glycosyltransferase [Agrobacterium tumefaciens]
MKLADQSDIDIVKASGLLDEPWYLERHPEVQTLGIDPVEHYLWIGWRLNRSPSPKFCAPSYIDGNPDVARSGLNPLLHYAKYGRNENRPVYPLMAPGDKESRVPVKRILVRRHVEWNDRLDRGATDELREVNFDTAPSLVSVVMPTKNRMSTIETAIRSVMRQTHRNWELIIIDDGGTDETQSVVASFADNRIRYLKQDASGGVSRARNIGLSAARGEWIFFLDSDNSWRDDMVELSLKNAYKRSLSAGYCAADLIDDHGRRKSVLYADFDYESCVRENFIDLNCFFVRWEGEFKTARFDENLRRLVDWDFIMKIAAHTRVMGSPFVGVHYYDGNIARISNQEHKSDVLDLVRAVRGRARTYSQTAKTICDASSYRIAVVFHVFHPDSVDGCAAYLRNIPFDFDLFITTSLKEDDPCLTALLADFPSATVYRFPNHGADIAPFLELIPTLKNYSLVCKIHTKRNVGKWGASWRNELLNSVLESPSHIQAIVDLFKENRNVVLAGSRDLYKEGRRNSIPETLRRTQKLADELGMDEAALDGWGFIAGTMLWVRPLDLLPLARHMCESPGYSKIFRQDGALEHALERMIGLTLTSKGNAEVALSQNGKLRVLPAATAGASEGVSITLSRALEEA